MIALKNTNQPKQTLITVTDSRIKTQHQFKALSVRTHTHTYKYKYIYPPTIKYNIASPPHLRPLQYGDGQLFIVCKNNETIAAAMHIHPTFMCVPTGN